jgi:hypothetical protein
VSGSTIRQESRPHGFVLGVEIDRFGIFRNRFFSSLFLERSVSSFLQRFKRSNPFHQGSGNFERISFS